MDSTTSLFFMEQYNLKTLHVLACLQKSMSHTGHTTPNKLGILLLIGLLFLLGLNFKENTLKKSL